MHDISELLIFNCQWCLVNRDNPYHDIVALMCVLTLYQCYVEASTNNQTTAKRHNLMQQNSNMLNYAYLNASPVTKQA